MREFVIQPEEKKKGRSFQATCAALMTADLFNGDASSKMIRPIWAVFAGTDTELRPFIANLKLGRKAIMESDACSYSRRSNGDRFEFIRSVGFLTAVQREPEGCLVTLFHPTIFRLDPGLIDPDGLSFVTIVPRHWAEQQKIETKAAVDHVLKSKLPIEPDQLRALVPTAYLFAAYLDRRTRCPLIADGRFYLQLLCAALDAKLASLPGEYISRWRSNASGWGHNPSFGFNAESIESVGVLHAIAFGATHERFEEFLAEQVETYFRRVGARAKVGRRVTVEALEAANGAQ